MVRPQICNVKAMILIAPKLPDTRLRCGYLHLLHALQDLHCSVRDCSN